jgi:hypothetical protein
MGSSWVLHHVQNPTLTGTGCFILGSLDIYDVEIGHEYLVSASSSLSVRATAIYKFEPHFIMLPLKSTSHHHNIFPRDPCQYSYFIYSLTAYNFTFYFIPEELLYMKNNSSK